MHPTTPFVSLWPYLRLEGAEILRVGTIPSRYLWNRLYDESGFWFWLSKLDNLPHQHWNEISQEIGNVHKVRGPLECFQSYSNKPKRYTYLKFAPKWSTTPLWQWGFRQCLPFSWTTLRGKHCRHPIAVMGVVDTFQHSRVWVQNLQLSSQRVLFQKFCLAQMIIKIMEV